MHGAWLHLSVPRSTAHHPWRRLPRYRLPWPRRALYPARFPPRGRGPVGTTLVVSGIVALHLARRLAQLRGTLKRAGLGGRPRHSLRRADTALGPGTTRLQQGTLWLAFADPGSRRSFARGLDEGWEAIDARTVLQATRVLGTPRRRAPDPALLFGRLTGTRRPLPGRETARTDVCTHRPRCPRRPSARSRRPRSARPRRQHRGGFSDVDYRARMH